MKLYSSTFETQLLNKYFSSTAEKEMMKASSEFYCGYKAIHGV